MIDINDIVVFTGVLAIFLIMNYAVFAYGGYLLFFKLLSPRNEHRKIIENSPDSKQISNELKRSLTTNIIFLIMGAGLYIFYKLGFTKIYNDYNEYGTFYFLISIIIMHQLHDAYFYWTHRLMHEFRPLRKYHFVHHESVAPNPYSALSFHPVEAIVHGFFWYLISFLLPIHSLWLFLFYSFMFYINMWGHNNLEFWHKDLLTHPILKHLNTPTHHVLHHKYHNRNYGIYYNLWDNLCGTNHEKYEEHYTQIKIRTEMAKTSKILKKLKL